MDLIGGEAGNDFTGGDGPDVLIAGIGGARDTFHYNSWLDSTWANPDLIINFDPHHDRIDLSIYGHGQMHFELDAPAGPGTYAPDCFRLLVSDDPNGGFPVNHSIEIYFHVHDNHYADYSSAEQMRQDMIAHVGDWLTAG